MAITGQGNASKEQVASMLKSILKMDELAPNKLDATDGLAAAVCHFFQQKVGMSSGKSGGWNEFIKNNPGRVM